MLPSDSKAREEEIAEIREVISKVNPNAEIVESTYSNVNLDFLIEKSKGYLFQKPQSAHHHKHDKNCQTVCLTHQSKVLSQLNTIYLQLDSTKVINLEIFE